MTAPAFSDLANDNFTQQKDVNIDILKSLNEFYRFYSIDDA
jgi:hypothetical protein